MMQRKAVEGLVALQTLADQVRLYKKWNKRAFMAQHAAFVGVRGHVIIDDMPCGHVVALTKALRLRNGSGPETMVALIRCPECNQKAAELSLWPPVP